jgi:hypothetical protein
MALAKSPLRRVPTGEPGWAAKRKGRAVNAAGPLFARERAAEAGCSPAFPGQKVPNCGTAAAFLRRRMARNGNFVATSARQTP